MRTNRVARMGLFVVMLVVLQCPARLAAQTSEKDIDERIIALIAEMKAAKDIGAIIKVRDEIPVYYQFVAGKGRGTLCARRMSALMPGPLLIEMPDRVKQINTAIALSKIPEAEIQPALDVMVAHSNPAVRYLGWRGYMAVREAILAHRDAKRTGTLLAVLAARARAEDSPVVLRSVLSMARFPASATALVPADRLAKAHQQSLAALAAAWRNWSRPVMERDLEMTEACQDAVAALLHSCRHAPNASAAKKVTLQLIYEMMHCSSSAYQKVESTGPVGEANAALLADCEKAMVALSGVNAKRVQDALKLENKTERTVKVGIAVIEWRERLKLRKPKFKPKAPATKPATRPATKPATRPTTGPTTKPAT